MTNKQRKALSELWRSWTCGPADRHLDCRALIDYTLGESKRHDAFRGSSIARGMSVLSEARYFALKRLAEFAFTGEDWSSKVPDVAGFNHYQHSVYCAYALVHDLETSDDVQRWAEVERERLYELMTWDYSEMIQHDPAT